VLVLMVVAVLVLVLRRVWGQWRCALLPGSSACFGTAGVPPRRRLAPPRHVTLTQARAAGPNILHAIRHVLLDLLRILLLGAQLAQAQAEGGDHGRAPRALAPKQSGDFLLEAEPSASLVVEPLVVVVRQGAEVVQAARQTED